jgi:thiamine-phosphate diphosphorylase
VTERPRAPILCLVTDRHRAYPQADSPDALACLVSIARAAADADIDLIQIRERDLEAAVLAALVSSVLDAVRGSRTRVVVNERLDVAVACGAAGVHLRADSIPVATARALAPDLFIGRSVHSPQEAEASAAAGADYLIAGTVFDTVSKSGSSRLLGVDGLAAIVRASHVPVLAIGGVTANRAAEIFMAGAAGIAAIGYFLDDASSPCRSGSIVSRASALRDGFDSVRTAP